MSWTVDGTVFRFVPLLLLTASVLCADGRADEVDDAAPAQDGRTVSIEFRMHEIAQPGGSRFGQTSAIDVDRDRDLDFVSGRQWGDVFWFENQGGERWIPHLIGHKALTDVGGTMLDVDGDGWIDQVSGGTWFRNPGSPATAGEWPRFENGATPTHDNVAADIDGDGRTDVVALRDESGVFWYGIPDDPTTDWVEHPVIGVTRPPCHGGLAVGDVDGDGDNDITRVDRWMENTDGRGTSWTEHRSFDFGREGPWGLQTRAELVDVDADGDLDLIQAEGDVFDGRVAWFENRLGDGQDWRRHLIRDSGHRQDLHSLCVADFDNDGDPDVFSGGGPLTRGPHRWFLWENADGRGGRWKEHQIQKGLRTHESVCADVDGDGDVDILTKPWRGDLHLFAENLRIRNGGDPTSR